MTYTTTPELLKHIRTQMFIDDISIKTLSERMYKTQAATSALFRRSNISLDSLKELCEALNYTLDIDINKKNDES